MNRRRGLIALAIAMSIGSASPLKAEEKGRRIPPALHVCAPGSQTVYRLEYTSSSHSNPNALFGDKAEGASPLTQPTEIQSTVASDLAVTVVRPEKSGCTVIFEFRQPAVTLLVNGRAATTQVADLQKSLATEIVGKVDRNGRIESVAFDPAVGHLARSYAQTILGMTQFVAPPGPAETWEVREEDPTGTYVAEYRQAAEAGHYEKRKLRYQLIAPEDELSLVTSPSGVLIAAVGPDGRIGSIQGEELQRVTVGTRELARSTNRLVLQSRQRRTLSRGESTDARARAAQRLAVSQPVALSTRSWDEATRIALKKQTLAGATTADLLAELRRLEENPEPDPSAEALLGRKMGALLFLHPDEAPSVAALLARASADSVTLRVVPGALSRAGTAEAQEALASALRNQPADSRVAFQLTSALSMLEKPTLRAEQALRRAAFASDSEEISYNSQLALAAMARTLEASGSEDRAASIVRDLTAVRQADRADKGIQRMLTILGNSGSARAFPVIQPFLWHASPEIRERAIHALRFLRTPEAEEIIVQALTDVSEDVREEAASILEQRPLTPRTLEVQKQRYLAETAIPVRLALLGSIARRAEEDAAIRAIIENAAEDASEEIRKAASRYLSRIVTSD